jgi:hypothetical protein
MTYPLTDVRHFQSDDPGAPALNHVKGTLFAVLDACLLTGYGAFTPDSIVAADGWAVVTKSTGHGYRDAVVVLVSGASPAGLNGTFRIEGLSSTQFRYPIDMVATATGTISIKMAPQGNWEVADSVSDWRRLYCSTHSLAFPDRGLEVYDTDNTGEWVDCRYGTGYWAVFRGWYATSFASGGAFEKGSRLLKARTAATYPWRVVCDSRAIYFQCGGQGNSGTTIGNWPNVCFFGDAAKAPNNYCTLSAGMSLGSTTLQYAPNASSFSRVAGASSTDYGFMLRDDVDSANVGYSMGLSAAGLSYSWNPTYLGYDGYVPYPLSGTADGALIQEAPLARQNTSNKFAGCMPGVYVFPHSISYFSDNTPLEWAEENRLLLALKSNCPGASSTTYRPSGGFIDLIGPWR